MSFIFYLIFGAILGSAFNLFEGVTMSVFSTILALIGLAGLSALPKTYRGFYLFGVAFHTVSLFWVGQSLHFAQYTIGVDLGVFAPFASFFIALILALQFPIALKVGGANYWMIPFLFIDFARSYSTTFFPWNFIGYTATLWLSSFRFLGILGMTTSMLLLSHLRQFPKQLQLVFMALSGALVIDHYWYQNLPITFSDTTVKIVQTNIEQNYKMSCYQINQVMTLSKEGHETKFIVWPESVVMGCLIGSPDLRQKIATILSPNSILLLGHLHYENDLYTSLSALNNKGELLSTYDKQKLVPFGEYTPFLLRIPKLTHGKSPFKPGKRSHYLKVIPKAAPLICYETAFPRLLEEYPAAEWIVSISNDGWFGNSAGPYQHFHLARCRAIEARKPFVRSVNLGISGLIGPQGQVLATIPFRQEGSIDVTLPHLYNPRNSHR
jgi:apolipoprotein N-acyltransferase